MQDNSPNSFDPKLIDQGWADMAQRLDDALPLKPKRRRFAWLWFPLLLGVLTLAGTGWNAFQQQADKLPSAPVDQSPSPVVTSPVVASSSAAAIIPAEAVEVITQTINETIKSSRPTVASSTNSPASPVNIPPSASMMAPPVAMNPIASAPITMTKGLQQLPSSSTVNGVPDSTTDDVEPSPSTGFEPDFITKAPPVADEVLTNSFTNTLLTAPITAEETNNYARTSTAVASLPNQAIELLATATDSEPILILSKRNPSFGNWRLYTEGQSTFGLGKDAGLLGLGLGVERKLSPSFSLDFGLFYEQSQQSLSTDGILSRTDSDIFPSEITNNSYSEAFPINFAYNRLAYTRLKGELLLNYKLGTRWKVGTGLSLAYYTKAEIVANDGDGIFSGIGVGPLDDNQVFLGNLYQDAVAVFEVDEATQARSESYPLTPARWQLAQQVRVQYQLTPRWAANASYRHNLTKWDENVAELGSPSFVQLGLRYYFK